MPNEQIARVAPTPKFHTVRIVAANDAVIPTDKRAGVNVADFDEIVLHGVLKNGATAADISALFWSEEAGAFLRAEAAATYNATTARRVLKVNRHDSVFFAVTGLTGGAGDRVYIEIAGVPTYNRIG